MTESVSRIPKNQRRFASMYFRSFLSSTVSSIETRGRKKREGKGRRVEGKGRGGEGRDEGTLGVIVPILEVARFDIEDWRTALLLLFHHLFTHVTLVDGHWRRTGIE